MFSCSVTHTRQLSNTNMQTTGTNNTQHAVVDDDAKKTQRQRRRESTRRDSILIQRPISAAVDAILYTSQFRMLAFNDIYTTDVDSQGTGGYAGISTLLKEYRSNTKAPTFSVVSGDFLGGSAHNQHFKGANIIPLLNALELDAVVLGNHEFDHGVDKLQERIKASNFRWFGSNVMHRRCSPKSESQSDANESKSDCGSISTSNPDTSNSDTHKVLDGITYTWTIDVPIHQEAQNGSSTITDVGSIRIGMFGVCTEDTPFLSAPGPDVRFDDITDTARTCVKHLRERDGADIIIALTHVSLAQDIALAQEVPGISVIVGGHDHEPYAQFSNGALVMKCGQNAQWLGVIDLHIRAKISQSDPSNRCISVVPSYNMVANVDVEQDQKMAEIATEWADRYNADVFDPEMDETVAYVADTTLYTLTEHTRRRETAFVCAMADSMQDYYNAQLAIVNGGNVRGNETYPIDSELTMRTVMTELPFPDNGHLLRLSGANLWAALEHLLSKAPAPFGGFPHLSRSMFVKYDIAKLPGKRIVKMLIDGKEVDPDATYTVATTQNMAEGGDGCEPFTRGETIHDGPQPLIKDIFLEWLLDHPSISGKRPHRLELVAQ
jgi:2',3'-cyclic-nucleotide 2'-phosphodiesterase (5'-nucleotidase family)